MAYYGAGRVDDCLLEEIARD